MMQSRSPPSSQMLRVWRPSGQELAVCNAEDFKDAAALKEHLWELCGCFPLYLQQLLHDGNVLGDGAELDASMDLQLVLLTISDGMFSVSQEPIWQMLLEETLIKWSVVCSKLVLIKISALTARQR